MVQLVDKSREKPRARELVAFYDDVSRGGGREGESGFCVHFDLINIEADSSNHLDGYRIPYVADETSRKKLNRFIN